MSLFSGFLLAIVLAMTASAQDSGWLRWFHGDLRHTERRIRHARENLASLGVPVMSQTTAELGYQHRQMREPPPVPPWLQIDLGESRDIDWIVLVPALVDWQPGEPKPYGFPSRFRIDASDDPDFAEFIPVAVFTESDFPSPGLSPAAFRASGLRARHVRVTVTKLAEENATHFFALSELMVVQGVRDIALQGKVTASNSINLPPRWHLENLNDGRSPLGPPVERDLLPYDGLFTAESGSITVDLGRAFPIGEIRLHPVHARLGADVPGFAFPLRFRIELSADAAFTDPAVLFDASAEDYPNPGNNPVVLTPSHAHGRFLRVLMTRSSVSRCGLSEIEVFSGGENVALGAVATSTPDPVDRPEERPASLITDGYTSYGRLLPLPEWLERWETRLRLQQEIRTLSKKHAALQAVAQRRAWTAAAALALLLPGAGLGWAVFERRKRVRRHDLIGSPEKLRPAFLRLLLG